MPGTASCWMGCTASRPVSGSVASGSSRTRRVAPCASSTGRPRATSAQRPRGPVRHLRQRRRSPSRSSGEPAALASWSTTSAPEPRRWRSTFSAPMATPRAVRGPACGRCVPTTGPPRRSGSTSSPSSTRQRGRAWSSPTARPASPTPSARLGRRSRSRAAPPQRLRRRTPLPPDPSRPPGEQRRPADWATQRLRPATTGRRHRARLPQALTGGRHCGGQLAPASFGRPT